jgi:predicted nucleic acid-binding protein
LSPLVVDVSAIAGQLLGEAQAAYADATLAMVAEHGAMVPPIFWYEVRNLLVNNERRGRLTPDQSDLFLGVIADLALEVDDLPHDDRALALARTHGLTVYDAAYLELAHRRRAVIATLDTKLAYAAHAAGVTVFKP